MVDRKQGAGLSSGSSSAVHKANLTATECCQLLSSHLRQKWYTLMIRLW